VNALLIIERQPGGRIICEVLRMIGYDRNAKRFLSPYSRCNIPQLSNAIQVDLAHEFPTRSFTPGETLAVLLRRRSGQIATVNHPV